jgi:hypothetical protein
MVLVTDGVNWSGSLLWLAGTVLVGFLVSWLFTERLRVKRSPYVAILALLSIVLAIAYTSWSGVGNEFWVHNWGWGVAGAVVAGAVLTAMVRRMSTAPSRRHRTSVPGILWDAVVYGAAEGLLLSVLPVAITWQAFAAAGWTRGWASIGAGVAAIAASLVVIVAHHLGYPEYRSKRMMQPVVGCSVLSLAYLLTGNPLAAMGAHMILHAVMMRRGMELPPTEAGEQQARPSPLITAG